MFDIAFSELVVIAVVALIVIGPEKLPKVARTVGLLVGRLQRYVSTVKADIDRELRIEELNQLRQDIHQNAQTIHSDINTSIAKAKGEVKEIEQGVTNVEPSVKASVPSKSIGDTPAK